MTITNIQDAILLAGPLPEDGEATLSVGDGGLVSIAEPLEHLASVQGQISLTDVVKIDGVIYTVTGLYETQGDYQTGDGLHQDVQGLGLQLTGPDDQVLNLLVPLDSQGDQSEITQISLHSQAVDDPVALDMLDDDQDVTLGEDDDGLNYIVEGTEGDDIIDGGYTGDPEGDRVDHDDNAEGNDDDVILGFGGDDLIHANDGDDFVDGGAGDDTIYGQAGDDVLEGGEGDDFVHGGNGDDTLSGGDGDDTLSGNAGDDVIDGGDGDDTARGGNGDDLMDGGDGNDTLHGNAGDDVIVGGDGSDVVFGGNGDDMIDTSGSQPASDYGWPGVVAPDADPYDDRDQVFGGAGDDVILTGDDQDTIDGGEGDDTIDGGLDDDTIDGGSGDDLIIGGHGSDEIDGGQGDDTIYGGMGPDTDPFNVPDVDQPGDIFPGADPVPSNGIDVIHGGAGDDTIYGQDDADELYGDEGDDIIDGGIDNDLIDGGAGDDTLLGGADEDTFVNLNAGDTVDGGAGGVDHDVLDLTGSAPEGGSLNVTLTGPDSNGNGYDGYVTYFDADGNETGTLEFEEIEEIVPCFTPGTLIATPRGERLVEELREGDTVITRDNGIQEIRWIGTRKLSWRDLMLAEHLQPVLIRAGSLGEGLPERDMLVSPNHRVLVSNDRTALYFEESEVLVAAKHLIDNRGIFQVPSKGASYIHFMFDRHEVVLSNGAWTESFQPGDYSLKGVGNAQRIEILELFPELECDTGIAAYGAARRTLKKHEARVLLK